MTQKQESIDTRIKMARMHDTMLQKLDEAMDRHEYVEACWLCYAIFEQRITRMIQKHIHKCPRQKRAKNDHHVGIATRINCISKLAKQNYGAYATIDRKVFKSLLDWCDSRNRLVHALLDINIYKKYDAEFQKLAKTGYDLVLQVYAEAAKVRSWCNDNNHFGKFPDVKCRCKKKRCIVEEE